LAIELARCGCDLLLTALEVDDLDDLLNELQEYPIKAAPMTADLSNPENRKKVLGWIREYKQPPDILVNNVGMGGQFG
ncbi:MAG: SDR family NAD(P)-dependent oxidoreductase, partial [Aliifodinibius sp.]|nr:SDR family NAD(P)-dependent oxidoreductase [Fodinibius sp.]NIV13189.1 SDR family NAD(P)-dependent oxidoreductase [Fodinibius sp.]NIY26856.1 SDR family NAD(P)-dependent oxidoreductase [Fodinibius sp.]